jgi:hypothetical protein
MASDIPLTFMDQIQNLEIERDFKQKMFLIQFLAVAKMENGKTTFETNSF